MNEPARRTKVLVVDDERAIADTFVLILNQNGFEAIAANSGEQAIAAAKEFQPDILLTDVVMPGITGMEAAVAITGGLPLCRVLLMSGNPHAGPLLEAAEGQGHAFEILAKPLHPAELMTRLRA